MGDPQNSWFIYSNGWSSIPLFQDNSIFLTFFFFFRQVILNGHHRLCFLWDNIFVPWSTWFIPVSKSVIILVTSGVTLFSPFITRVITYLVSGMNHQAWSTCCWGRPQESTHGRLCWREPAASSRCPWQGLYPLMIRVTFLIDQYRSCVNYNIS